MRFQDGIVAIPNILVPGPGVDLEKWAVVACDQFTSEPAYWDRVETLVGTQPSALRVVLPEIRLAEPEAQVTARIDAINAAMAAYLCTGVLSDVGRCVVLTRREVPGASVRTGLVIAIDLDQYAYEPGNAAPIRATEGTVLERIPPRVRIRENAPLELPHVQLLMDDPQNTVIDPLASLCAAGVYPLLYDTPLMFGGGRIRGYRIPAGDPALDNALGALYRLDTYRNYGLMMAVGDGNHSLVTAKACWERMRGTSDTGHPARYAMAELINLHDGGLVFEPIHRILFGCPLGEFLALATESIGAEGCAILPGDGQVPPAASDGQPCDISAVSGGQHIVLRLAPSDRLAVDRIQPIVDTLSERKGIRVDYIHGDAALRLLASEGNTGILLPTIGKDRFFPDIVHNGVYPRKTFSMGDAAGKRYYIEARRIR